MVSNKQASVILLNYNCMKFIDPLLESLRRQTYSPAEVLLFDNGSTDGSAADGPKTEGGWTVPPGFTRVHPFHDYMIR